MKRWSLFIVLALLASLVAGTASAQERELDRFAFGIGIGLVDLSDTIDDESTETYITASFRILLGDKDKRRDDQSIIAYVEPELGYWEADDRIPLDNVRASQSDFMFGVNIVGVVPFDKVDYFFGAGLAIHSFDADLAVGNVTVDASDDSFGVNIHTGIDVHIGEKVDVYGLLRLDLVEDVQEEQAKIVLGVRFRFG